MTHARRARSTLLFEGADWDFDTLARIHDAIERDRRRRARPRHLSEPDRGDHRRADARRLFLDRHAAVLQALVVRQAFRPQRGALPQGLHGPRLRDRHQLQSLHLLHHGGELRDDAGAGASPTPPSATTTSSRTTTCSSSGPTPTASSTISSSPRAISRSARSATARPRSSALLDAAHALMSHGVHRYPAQARAGPALRGAARARSAARTASRSSTISGAPCRARAARRATGPMTTTGAARCSSCRRRTSSISSRRPRRGCSPGSARSCASSALIAQYFYPQRQTKVMNEGCATYRHHRIMNAAARAAARSTTAPFLEFLHSHTNVVLPAGFRRPALFGGINPYALGFAHDAATSSASAPTPTEEDRAVVPRHRRQRRRHGTLQRRLGELPRRELHRRSSSARR